MSRPASLILSFLSIVQACDDGSAPRADTADGGDLFDSDTSDAVSEAGDASAEPDWNTVPGDPDVLVGSFAIRLVPPVLTATGGVDTAGTTSVLGRVSDGPTPELVRFVPDASAGDCTLFLPSVPHCNTPCGGAAACVDDDVCQDYPTAQSLGTVTLSGVADAAGRTTLQLESIGGSYQPIGASLPFPAFAEGDTIGVATSGGAYAPFSVSARGVAPLAVTSHDLVVAPERSLALEWEAPAAAADSVVEVKLDVSHHGGTKGVIRCTSADDGALAIDASLVSALLDLGFAGLPTVVLTRSSTGSRTIAPGRVDLVVSSVVELPVSIPGLVSCNSSDDCPDGQTCQDDLSCQ